MPLLYPGVTKQHKTQTLCFCSQEQHDHRTAKRRWEEEMEELRRKTKNEISELEFAKSSLERQRASLEDELTSKQQEIAGLKITVSQLTSAQEGIKAQLEATKVNHL